MLNKYLMSFLLFTILISITSADEIKYIYKSFKDELKINDENELLYNNKSFNPNIVGNQSLAIEAVFSVLGNNMNDVVLIHDNGGDACPSLYYFITLSKSGAKPSPEFGSCGEILSIKKEIDDSIIVAMSGYLGPFEDTIARERESKKIIFFVYKDGVVTKNGKKLK